MKRFFLGCAIFFLELLFKLRYSVRYKGLDHIQKVLQKSESGALFLSNHPAIFLDGLMVTCPLLKAFDVRTLIIEYMFFSPIAAPLLKWIRAVPVPNFGTGSNSVKLYRLHKALEEVSRGLRSRENFLLYPAGMTKQTGREVIGGAFAVHDIIKASPNCPIVMVRLVGLWGSRFSRAQNNGESVDWVIALKRSLLDLFKAGLFFLPRRKVEVTFEIAEGIPREGSKAILNRWLEEWFNAPFEKKGLRGEPLHLVSYSPWKKEIPDIQAKEAESVAQVSPEIREKVLEWLSQHLHVNISEISPKAHLIADLGLDSLALAELITYLEAELDTPRILPQDLSTVASLMLAVQGIGKGTKEPVKEWDQKGWFQERKKQRISMKQGKTIPDQFFQTADRHMSLSIAVDERSGPVTYQQLKRSLFIVAYHIQKKVHGKRVGILLPDTTAAHVLTMACQMAGKTPVLLNWTLGGKNMKAVTGLAGIQTVLTSFAFVDLLENVDLSPIQESILFLEEFKGSFSLVHSLLFSCMSYLPYRYTKYSFLFPKWRKLHRSDEAVLLFTSGTESEPKGVPLTHDNILTDLRGALEVIALYSTDKLMSLLPPFHSFGFSVTGLMPLLAGVPVYFFPNPTDGSAIADIMRRWKTNLICSAPSFLKNIFLHGKKEPFKDLRLIVTGAEKATDDFFKITQETAPCACVIEGYGITECSPILTINETGNREEGVGKPLPGVRLRIVDIDNYEKSKNVLEDGMILASGPNVFSGYLQKQLASPFYNNWYVTGDLGHLTSHGSLVITGRLKRFVKIGGEMIGLPAVEDGLASLIPHSEEGPTFSVVSVEKEGSAPKLVLVTKEKVALTDANLELRKKGFSNLVRLDKVLEVSEIPVTATGKVSLRELADMAKRSYDA